MSKILFFHVSRHDIIILLESKKLRKIIKRCTVEHFVNIQTSFTARSPISKSNSCTIKLMARVFRLKAEAKTSGNVISHTAGGSRDQEESAVT